MTLTTGKHLSISPLKKVTLSFKAGTQSGLNDLNPENETFDIIFGLGIDGLTPFEFQLSDKIAGDILHLELHPDDVCKTFKHIRIPQFNIPAAADSIFLTFQVENIVEADSREVIKAMAELSSCSGGSCECCSH